MILTYKGIKIKYSSEGNGIPIVFLHGFLENSSMWKETVTYLPNTYQCITIDLLGHGETECIGYIHTIEEMAKAVKAVLDHIKVSKVVLVGHSMGGYVALALIDFFPDLVSGLVLLNSTSYADSEERKINRERAIGVVKKNPQAFTSMAIANLFAQEHRDQHLDQIQVIKKIASLTPLQGIIAALEGMKIRKDNAAVLSNFEGAKIIFSGKQDPVLSHANSQRESKECNTDLVSFDGGHMTYLENKGQYLLELSNFLSVFLTKSYM
ncbi:alpha/beta fold hydrolase [Aquimarina pacifica]|uniref:alpha/beta fold hydrolase n=1 Tax=Aquimarina pacifica TaxID=1296415 RepID=UPI0004713CFD|nr:alpha/beta hydrolase [Aquimarina pacifica]